MFLEQVPRVVTYFGCYGVLYYPLTVYDELTTSILSLLSSFVFSLRQLKSFSTSVGIC